jgi:hypothetical protein
MTDNTTIVQRNPHTGVADLPILRGRPIRKDDHERICLNDIWRAAGAQMHKAPLDWKRLPRTLGLMRALEQTMGFSHGFSAAIISKPGRSGGTFAEPKLALDYAEYLSPELALEVKDIFLRYLAADAALADDVLERTSPEANEWAGVRALSRAQRRKYTDCLQAHGVKDGREYAACSDTLYLGLFDKRAAALKSSKGLSKSASLRDHLSTDELAFVVAGETLARERIDEEGADGGEACRIATQRSAQNLRRGVEMDRADRKGRTPPPANENLKTGNAA